jgi:hypothetical protein
MAVRYAIAGRRRMKRQSELSAGDAEGQDSEHSEKVHDGTKAVMGHAHGPCSCSNGNPHNTGPDLVSGRLAQVHETFIPMAWMAIEQSLWQRKRAPDDFSPHHLDQPLASRGIENLQGKYCQILTNVDK